MQPPPTGLDVILVLTSGLGLNLAIGLLRGTLGWSDFLSAVGNGIAGMGNLIIVTLLAGGMLALIRHGGGLEALIQALTRRIRGKRGAELSIAALVSLANLCTANNTIAIITTGGIARDITEKYKLDPRKSASIQVSQEQALSKLSEGSTIPLRWALPHCWPSCCGCR